MSLRVWLPLVKDNLNQGLDDLQPTIDSTQGTIVTGGKLGNCFKTTTTGNIATNYVPNINSGSLSFGGWFKFNKAEIQTALSALSYTSTKTTATGNLIGNDSYGGIGLIWTSNNLYNSDKELTTINVFGALRTNTTNQSTSAVSIAFDTWIHFFLVWDYDNRKYKFYKGGNLVATLTYVDFTDGSVVPFTLNRASIYGGNGPGASIPYLSNDIRIYDHALSPKEVKLLSQGLVCHYKLSDPYIEGTTNLITSLTKGGQTTVSGNSVTTSGENKDTYFTLNLSEDIVVGTQYTISCYAEGIPSGSVWNFPVGGQSNTSLLWVIHSGYNSYTFTANDFNWGTKRVFMDDSSRTFYGVTRFYDFQLEKNDHATPYAGLGGTRNDTIVYDCSGYNNHCNVEGTLSGNSNTPRNAISTYFTSPAGAFAYLNITLPQFTFSFWAKHTIANRMLMGSNASLDSTNNKWYWYGDNSFKYDGGEFYYEHNAGSAESLFGTWIHFVATYDGSAIKIYRNGISEGSKSVTGNKVLEYLSLGNGYISNYRENGYLSDFRLYATALSQEDIQQLYNTPMSVANTGTMLTQGEFVEVAT